jgi:hypothetical protein
MIDVALCAQLNAQNGNFLQINVSSGLYLKNPFIKKLIQVTFISFESFANPS